VVWAVAGVHGSLPSTIPFQAGGITETMRLLAWAGFVQSVITLGLHEKAQADARAKADNNAADEEAGFTSEYAGIHSPEEAYPSKSSDSKSVGLMRGQWFVLLAAFILLLQLGLVHAANTAAITAELARLILPILWIIAALTGLVLLEKLYRYTAPERRHSIRYLCIGVGAMFIFDFFVFTDTLLFRRIEHDLWQARGVIYSALVPLVALSIARNPNWALQLHISRSAVTGSVSILGCGVYLLATALAATVIRYSGVPWAGVAETAFIFLAVVGLVILVLSSSIRARTRVTLSKNLFSYKYDYRHEWLKFTETLTGNPDDAPGSIVKGLTAIVESESGALWGKSGSDRLELLATQGISGLQNITSSKLTSLDRFLQSSEWLVDLDEYRAHPERYSDLQLPDEFINNSAAWLIVPLPFQDQVIGIALISRSMILKHINWEDRDLLKTAGHQAAGILAQRRAHHALSEARQFEAFSKLSAYIVHDLKNILGQQSLIVSNASKHKHNPEFIDDAIATIDNSVNRMHVLLKQLRGEKDEQRATTIDLTDLLKEAVSGRDHIKPTPSMDQLQQGLYVQAQYDRMLRVFGHLIQNAQEACAADGSVSVSLEQDHRSARIIVQDTGKGMNSEFVRNKLFKPFESTKGLTGMGIGAYESREYVRALGGDIVVESNPGEGTTFTITIPLVHAVLVTTDGVRTRK